MANSDDEFKSTGEDLYPNEGSSFYFPSEPEEQVKERQHEHSQTIDNLELLDALIEADEARLKELDSIDSIPEHLTRDPATMTHEIAGRKVAAEHIRVHLEWLKGLRER